MAQSLSHCFGDLNLTRKFLVLSHVSTSHLPSSSKSWFKYLGFWTCGRPMWHGRFLDSAWPIGRCCKHLEGEAVAGKFPLSLFLLCHSVYKKYTFNFFILKLPNLILHISVHKINITLFIISSLLCSFSHTIWESDSYCIYSIR